MPNDAVAASWLRAALPGYCAVTSSAGDCVHGTGGSFSLTPAESLSWNASVSACMERCRHCARCNFISVSRRWRDCSWLRPCKADLLYREVRGFRTAPVPARWRGSPPPASSMLGHRWKHLWQYFSMPAHAL